MVKENPEKPVVEKKEPEKGVATKEKPQAKPKSGPFHKEKREEKRVMRVIVRVLGTDLDGEKKVRNSILKIKGVSHSLASAVCKVAKIDPNKKLGSFTESEIGALEEVIRNPLKFGIPVWAANRRRDMESGMDMHVSGSDVDVTRKFDVQRMVDKKTYKGIRHMLGLPVRGQRTKSSFRKGKTVGVVRKAARLAAGGGAKKEPEKK